MASPFLVFVIIGVLYFTTVARLAASPPTSTVLGAACYALAFPSALFLLWATNHKGGPDAIHAIKSGFVFPIVTFGLGLPVTMRPRTANPIAEPARDAHGSSEGGQVPEDNNPQPESHKGVSIMKKHPMQFDSEELQILQDFERGEFESIRNFQSEKRELEEAARNTLQKDKRINIRISSRDLERIQMRAAREGVPYQTYISSSLHKLVAGRLTERV